MELAPDRNICTLKDLWHCFGLALAKGILEEVRSSGECGGRVCSASKVFAGLLWEGTSN